MEPGAEIVLPPCRLDHAESLCVPLEEPCQTICRDRGQCACVWTSTRKQASVSVACAGDAIAYTITFTNHSPFSLEDVRISDDIPGGIAVISGSIQPAPGPGEALQTGISMGSVAAGGSVALTYRALVRSCAPECLVNRARAEYRYRDCSGCFRRGTGSCKRCVVQVMPCCRCKCVQRCFSVCDFACFRYCYVYHTGIVCHDTPDGRVIRVGFGIAVKYIDSDGEKRGTNYEDSITFAGLPRDLEPACFAVRLTNLVCRADCHGCIHACFTASLCDEKQHGSPCLPKT